MATENPKTPSLSFRKPHQRQGLRHVAEEGSFSLFLNVPNRTSFGQSK